ncbi:TonB-dependent receptor plug domain-containing protein [Treponema sp. R6D11]
MKVSINKYILLIIFFLSAIPLFCRDITVLVIDEDLELPLEGASVRTRGGNEYICGKDGKAKVQVPDDRQVLLYAAYPGYETGTITIPVTGNSFTVYLRLSGFLQGRELVIEAPKPGTSESKTGRSVAVGEKEIAQTAEIGVIEDVMSTIKLLPGVGYSGLFNAAPSIRGGQPGDMMAVLDGFYINSPYFWGGGFSIFDPRMVKSAQLSHGVFSSRYGHTISGLLEITSKEPSPTETELELGLNTSAANFNLSVPLNGKGGILFMGRVTYYDPVIWGAKELSHSIPELEVINYIRTAPYIRAGTISGNYRFTDNLVISATGFFGMDGGGVLYLNENRTEKLNSDTNIDVDYVNYQTFLTSSLSWNPRNDMLLKFTAGAGYEGADMDGIIENKIHNKKFTDDFYLKYQTSYNLPADNYQYYQEMHMVQTDTKYNIQGRIDYDWKLSNNFLAAIGAQELFSVSKSKGDQHSSRTIPFNNIDETSKNYIIYLLGFVPAKEDNLRIEMPMTEQPNTQNKLMTTSGYLLGEFNTDGNRFGAELGVRMDHFMLLGDGFTLQSDPVFNPRLNIDFNILRNKGIFNSIDISTGTGFFSSIDSTVFDAEKKYNLDRIKPNRSWTSILGIKFEFPESLILNIEGYYKKIFDRMYVLISSGGDDTVKVDPYFNGEGIVWGVDVMLQKIQSRFWDGWLSYSYNWAKYREPNGELGGMVRSGGNRGDDWYFPSYHRFHNLNLVLNVKPTQKINIYTRLGIASGGIFSKREGDGPVSGPVLIYKGKDSYIIEEFSWASIIDENNRTTPSVSMDIKISFFGGNKTGKTRHEFYFAIENVLGLLYTPQGNTNFNQYTGEVNEGSFSASYDIPIPIPSFGFKLSY